MAAELPGAFIAKTLRQTPGVQALQAVPRERREPGQSVGCRWSRKIRDIAPCEHLIRTAATCPIGTFRPGSTRELARSNDVVDTRFTGEPAPGAKAGDTLTKLRFASHGVRG